MVHGTIRKGERRMEMNNLIFANALLSIAFFVVSICLCICTIKYRKLDDLYIDLFDEYIQENNRFVESDRLRAMAEDSLSDALDEIEVLNKSLLHKMQIIGQ